jgi:hypothetical protein
MQPGRIEEPIFADTPGLCDSSPWRRPGFAGRVFEFFTQIGVYFAARRISVAVYYPEFPCPA